MNPYVWWCPTCHAILKARRDRWEGARCTTASFKPEVNRYRPLKVRCTGRLKYILHVPGATPELSRHYWAQYSDRRAMGAYGRAPVTPLDAQRYVRRWLLFSAAKGDGTIDDLAARLVRVLDRHAGVVQGEEPELTVKKIGPTLYYDPENGVFTWPPADPYRPLRDVATRALGPWTVRPLTHLPGPVAGAARHTSGAVLFGDRGLWGDPAPVPFPTVKIIHGSVLLTHAFREAVYSGVTPRVIVTRYGWRLLVIPQPEGES